MDWKLKYEEIVEELGLDRIRDRKAAEVLDGLVEEGDLGELEEKIRDRAVIVFGAGPSLKEDIGRVKQQGLIDKCTLIAADGAVKALMEEDIVADINVTDLDGDLRAIIWANGEGCMTVVHAHGDNISRLRDVVPKLRNVLGTTQTEAFGKLHNLGGFTDGDRCVSMALEVGAKEIILAGMDFGREIGEYSGQYNYERKIKKLEIGKKIIAELSKEFPGKIKRL